LPLDHTPVYHHTCSHPPDDLKSQSQPQPQFSPSTPAHPFPGSIRTNSSPSCLPYKQSTTPRPTVPTHTSRFLHALAGLPLPLKGSRDLGVSFVMPPLPLQTHPSTVGRRRLGSQLLSHSQTDTGLTGRAETPTQPLPCPPFQGLVVEMTTRPTSPQSRTRDTSPLRSSHSVHQQSRQASAVTSHIDCAILWLTQGRLAFP
jgi:hypothetical protein